MSERLSLKTYRRHILTTLAISEPDDYVRRFIAYYYENNISIWHAIKALRFALEVKT